MTTISLRFDDEMKKQLDEMCDEMGMNLTYSDSNMEQLKKANQQIKKRTGDCKNDRGTGGYGV